MSVRSLAGVRDIMPEKIAGEKTVTRYPLSPVSLVAGVRTPGVNFARRQRIRHSYVSSGTVSRE